jgi:hypothetical protein
MNLRPMKFNNGRFRPSWIAAAVVTLLGLVGTSKYFWDRRSARCEQSVVRWMNGCFIEGLPDLTAGFDLAAIGVAASITTERARAAFTDPCVPAAAFGRTPGVNVSYKTQPVQCASTSVICAKEIHVRNGVEASSSKSEYGFVCQDGLIVRSQIAETPDAEFAPGNCLACQWP